MAACEVVNCTSVEVQCEVSVFAPTGQTGRQSVKSDLRECFSRTDLGRSVG